MSDIFPAQNKLSSVQNSETTSLVTYLACVCPGKEQQPHHHHLGSHSKLRNKNKKAFSPSINIAKERRGMFFGCVSGLRTETAVFWNSPFFRLLSPQSSFNPPSCFPPSGNFTTPSRDERVLRRGRRCWSRCCCCCFYRRRWWSHFPLRSHVRRLTVTPAYMSLTILYKWGDKSPRNDALLVCNNNFHNDHHHHHHLAIFLTSMNAFSSSTWFVTWILRMTNRRGRKYETVSTSERRISSYSRVGKPTSELWRSTLHQTRKITCNDVIYQYKAGRKSKSKYSTVKSRFIESRFNVKSQFKEWNLVTEMEFHI